MTLRKEEGGISTKSCCVGIERPEGFLQGGTGGVTETILHRDTGTVRWRISVRPSLQQKVRPGGADADAIKRGGILQGS